MSGKTVSSEGIGLRCDRAHNLWQHGFSQLLDAAARQFLIFSSDGKPDCNSINRIQPGECWLCVCHECMPAYPPQGGLAGQVPHKRVMISGTRVRSVHPVPVGNSRE